MTLLCIGNVVITTYEDCDAFPPITIEATTSPRVVVVAQLQACTVGVNFNGVYILPEKDSPTLNKTLDCTDTFLYDEIVKWALLGDLEAFSFIHRTSDGKQFIITIFSTEYRKIEFFVDAYIQYKIRIRDGEALPPSRRTSQL